MTGHDLTPSNSLILPAERRILNGHEPIVLWFTGLSGSGKSSIASAVERKLVDEFKAHTAYLDGDSLRSGLNQDLGFSWADRQENMRRAGEAAKLLFDAGLIALVALISPLREERLRIRNLFPTHAYWEIFVSCPLEICRERDPKGLYDKAMRGEITEFTGVSSPYEAPLNPEILLETNLLSIDVCARLVVERLRQAGMLQ